MKPIVEIYDTTLRDGTQGEGINFSIADKIRIAEKLDAFGIHYIEGGWPGSNPKDMAFFEEIRKRSLKHSKVTAFGMTRRAKIKCSEDENIKALLAAQTPIITFVGKSWSLHVKEVIRTTFEENLAMISDSIEYMKEHGKLVFYDAEHFFDGYKDDPEYTLKTLLAAENAGAEVIILCDTNGGTLPHEVSTILHEVKQRIRTPLGIHTHNDCGVAVANALAAVESGAIQIQGTINGYGERTGNCNLTTTMANLVLKMGMHSISKEHIRHLKELSDFVDDLANLRPDIRQPFVGATAFAHKGGIHVNAVEKVARSYEHIEPESVGNTRRVLVSELSGRSNILLKAHQLGVDLKKDTPEIREVLNFLKEMEHKGYEFEAADASFQLLIQKALKKHKPFFELSSYRVIMDRGGVDTKSPCCEATIKLRIGHEVEHTVAEGDGPVNALDQALRAALVKAYPSIREVKLIDYKVRILDSSNGTAAKTRVIIESTDGNEFWGTVGVSDNIIEASWEALVDSFEYKLLRDEKRFKRHA